MGCQDQSVCVEKGQHETRILALTAFILAKMHCDTAGLKSVILRILLYVLCSVECAHKLVVIERKKNKH